MAKKRPGIIVYFDMLPAMEQLNDEQLGKLFRAMLSYGEYNVTQDFSDDPLLNLAWQFIQPRIDADGMSYREKTAINLYGTYCREAKKKGVEPVSYSFWCELTPEAQRKTYEALSCDILR